MALKDISAQQKPLTDAEWWADFQKAVPPTLPPEDGALFGHRL